MTKHKGEAIVLEDVKAVLKDGGQLLDVRTSTEFRGGHAQGAKNISLQALQSGTKVDGDKSKPVYVYCHSGARAGVAKRLLLQQGFKTVINIGGLGKWKQIGGKVQ
jgi:rhodanese-related sulfurtransferase